MSARRLRSVPAVAPSTQATRATIDYVETPVDTAIIAIDQAYAIIDVLYTLVEEAGAEADTGLGLCEHSLSSTLDSAMRRLEEARAAARKLALVQR